MNSHFVIGLLELFKLINDDRDISLTDANEIRVIEQALNREELLLFLLLDHADVLTELDQIAIELLLGLFAVLLAQN